MSATDNTNMDLIDRTIQSFIVIDGDGYEHNAHDTLTADAGDAPGSIFGTDPDQWTPFALAYYDAMTAGGAEPTIDLLDEAASVIVNTLDLDAAKRVSEIIAASEVGRQLLATL